MFAIAIHGGSWGGLRREQRRAEGDAVGAPSPSARTAPVSLVAEETDLQTALDDVLQAGYRVLEKDGAALDAAVFAVKLLEENPLFNAGRGAVWNRDGQIELDAAVMEGASRRAGAVAGVRHVKSPIELATRVMLASPHLLLIGQGAEELALAEGLELVSEDHFRTPDRAQEYERLRARRLAANTKTAAVDAIVSNIADASKISSTGGTVGAVALDAHGHLAAATSTGGMAGKWPGRVGDSPIIGAGTYADDATCAVSATGHGELFIRAAAAHDVTRRMAYGRLPLDQAAAATIADVAALGGAGGLIAVDRWGNIAMPFSSEGMLRACKSASGRYEIGL